MEHGLGPTVAAGSDNIDTYQVLDNSYLTNASMKISGRSVTNSLTQIGSVCRGPFPLNGTKEIQVLWISFLYPLYHTNTLVPNPIELSGIDYQAIQDAKFTVECDSSNVVKKAECFSPGSIVHNKQITHLSPPLDKGYVLWNIAASTTTNTSFGSFPQSITYRQFLPINGSKPFNQWSAYIAASNISLLEALSNETALLPVVTNRNLMTFDYRFSPTGKPARPGESAPLAMYYVFEGHWLGREQASAYDKGYKEVRVDPSVHQISDNHKWVAWGLFVLTTVGLLLVIWIAKRTNERNNERNI